jgi:predicted nuclease of predicted toxin-antitoxin system
LHRTPDDALLALAKSEGRTIVTADLDYPRLLALAGAANPSLILFRDGNWSDAEVVARMRDILQAMSAADLEQSILVVDRDRVRRRRLPLNP